MSDGNTYAGFNANFGAYDISKSFLLFLDSTMEKV